MSFSEIRLAGTFWIDVIYCSWSLVFNLNNLLNGGTWLVKNIRFENVKFNGNVWLLYTSENMRVKTFSSKNLETEYIMSVKRSSSLPQKVGGILFTRGDQNHLSLMQKDFNKIKKYFYGSLMPKTFFCRKKFDEFLSFPSSNM